MFSWFGGEKKKYIDVLVGVRIDRKKLRDRIQKEGIPIDYRYHDKIENFLNNTLGNFGIMIKDLRDLTWEETGEFRADIWAGTIGKLMKERGLDLKWSSFAHSFEVEEKSLRAFAQKLEAWNTQLSDLGVRFIHDVPQGV